MIFDDHLIQQGESGGKEAAGILWSSVKEYVHQRIPGLSSDCKIVTRVYANLKGLGNICQATGVLDSASLMEDFARGFTGSKQCNSLHPVLSPVLLILLDSIRFYRRWDGKRSCR